METVRRKTTPFEIEEARKTGTSRGKENNKKANITLSLDDSIIQELRKEAKESQQSLNVKINAILRKRVNFWQMTERQRCAILLPASHQFMINEIDETRHIEELKRLGADEISAVLTQTGAPRTLDHIIDFIFGTLCVYGGSIRSISRYTEQQEGKTCLYFLHDYDLKWSRILGQLFATCLKARFIVTLHSRHSLQGLKLGSLKEVLSRRSCEENMAHKSK